MFYLSYFGQEFSEKQEKQDHDKKEMQELIIEGITTMYKALRG